MDLVRAMMNPDTLRDLENMSDRINRLLAGRSRSDSGKDESMALVEWVPVVDVMETEVTLDVSTLIRDVIQHSKFVLLEVVYLAYRI